MNKVKPIIENQLKKDLPEFSSGDTIAIDVSVVEGGKERLQKFEGIVIGRKGSDSSAAFTVRKISGGIGVKRILPLHSPMISKIVRQKKGKVRRAKINNMRTLTGAKAIRIAEKK